MADLVSHRLHGSQVFAK